MPRAYLSADARCRQLERLVRQQPGVSAAELWSQVGMAYTSVCAYLKRLKREARVIAVSDEPALVRGATQRYYPPGHAALLKKVA